MMSHPSIGPLDTVTSVWLHTFTYDGTKSKPNPGGLSLARCKADLNSSLRSVIDVVRRSELLRLGAITRMSPGPRTV